MAFNDNVLRLNDDGTCTAGPLAKYPVVTSSDSSLTVTPITNATTGEVNYDVTMVDENTKYAFSVTNDYDGDGVIEITVTATETDGSTSNSVITITETETEQGQYFTGQPTIDAAGLVTFPTANDEGETVGTPITLDLSALISSPHPTFTGSGGITTTYTAGTNTWNVLSTDNTSTLVDNGDGTYTYQNVDVDGNAVGAPVVITGEVDTTDNSMSSDNTIAIAVTQNGDGSQTEDLTVNVCSKNIEVQQSSFSLGNIFFNRTQVTTGNYFEYDTVDFTIQNPSDCDVWFLITTHIHGAVVLSNPDSAPFTGVEWYLLNPANVMGHNYLGQGRFDPFSSTTFWVLVPAGGATFTAAANLYPDMTTDDDQFVENMGFRISAHPIKSFGGFK